MDKLQEEMSARRKSATWSEWNMKQNETRCNMKKVQHGKSATWAQHEKNATWKKV